MDLMLLMDDTTLAALSPSRVVGYLLAKGWGYVEPFGVNGGAYRLSRLDELERKVLVPVSGRIEDFARGMKSLLQDLGSIEGRDPLLVLADIQAPAA